MLVSALVTCCFLIGHHATADDVLLPGELGLVEARLGQQYRFVASYQSWMGKTLTLSGVDPSYSFVLASDDIPRILRTLPTRETELLWTVEARGHAPLPGYEYHILKAEPAPDFDTLHEQVRVRSRSLDPDHRLYVSHWLVRSARTEEVRSTSRDELLATLEVCARRTGPAGDDLAWLGLGQSAIGEDPRWAELVARFGARRGEEPAVRRELLERGFYLDDNGWRREEDFLAEIDMVRSEDGRRLTLEQHLLEQEIEEWGKSSGDIALLRRLTQKLYMEIAGQGLVELGMHRDEVVIARGYPPTVAWKRSGRLFYELWSYPDGWICFVDGKVFRWQ